MFAGVTFRLTQGVVKNIIPAVASTNACIANICATEVFKLATSCSQLINNYIVFNQSTGVYTYLFEAERKDDCLACSRSVTQRRVVTFKESEPLSAIMDMLTNKYQMKSPALTATKIDGSGSKTLYMSSIKSIEEATRPNLDKTLLELGLVNGQELLVADVTTPQTVSFHLNLVVG